MRRFGPGQVARATGLTVNGVHGARRRGHLRASIREGRWYFYTAEDVEAWVRDYQPKGNARRSSGNGNGKRYSSPRSPSAPGPTIPEPSNPEPAPDDTPPEDE